MIFRSGSRTDGWRPDLTAAVVPWIVARVCVLGGLEIAREAFDHFKARPPRPSIWLYDANYYRDLATRGYHGVQHDGLRFFPLYPLAGRALGWLAGGRDGAALLVISNVCAFGFIVLVHRLTRKDLDADGAAGRAAWFAAVVPSAMVLVVGYAEALLLLLTAAAFLAYRSRRWLPGAVVGYLAGLTRPTGVLLVVPAAIEAARGWRRGSTRERVSMAAAVVGPPAGLLTFLAWAGNYSGDWLLPLSLQNRKNLRGGTQDPFTRLWDAAGDLFGGQRFGSGLHVVWAVVFLFLVVVAIRRLPASYSAFAAVTVVLGLTAHNLDSFERYTLAAFPLAIALAFVTARPTYERLAVGLTSA
ncbi:MAG: hypothetical protein JWL73_2317, partial [Actinomycetia bacterium]|nr:hypothetical protein [Actinomycetes bacterium]